MKKALFILQITILSNFLFGQNTDTIKVLFIGNSFTSVNNLPQIFSDLSINSNKAVIVASHNPGGVSVGDINQGTSAHMNNPIVYELIRSNDWNYLVLQDNQGRFVYSYGVFPSSSLVIEGHIQIRDSLLFHHPCAKMIWFAGWGPKDGYPPLAETGIALIDSIYNNYRFLLDTAKQIIAPIGPAWQRIINSHPSINLWGVDDVHPSIFGSSLTANVIYSTIYKSNPTESSFIPNGISTVEDSILKNLAYQTVIDSISFTGLSLQTPEISINEDTLSINGFVSCDWYLYDVFLESNFGVLNISLNGNYSAIVYDQNNCEFHSNSVTISSLSLNYITEKEKFSIYPNPSDGYFTIKNDSEIKSIQIFNSIGNEIVNYDTSINENLLRTKMNTGNYIIKITDNNSTIFYKKLIILY
jgi:hypothetical protein